MITDRTERQQLVLAISHHCVRLSDNDQLIKVVLDKNSWVKMRNGVNLIANVTGHARMTHFFFKLSFPFVRPKRGPVIIKKYW